MLDHLADDGKAEYIKMNDSVNIEITRCDNCPYVEIHPYSDEWSVRFLWQCKISNLSRIANLIWRQPIPIIPSWCKLRKKPARDALKQTQREEED